MVNRFSYELDYTNSTQPQAETAYVIPSSSGSYASQPGSQQLVASPNGPHTSAAYSALSASIASLKSRLNSRGAALGGEPGQQSNQAASLYSTQQVIPTSYGSSQSLGSSEVPQQQQQPIQQQQSQQLQLQTHQQQQQAQQTHQSQQLPGQTTYLSVSSGQDQLASTNHSGDNKTIVLAIPAKINFLPDGRGTPKLGVQQHQQAQHLTVLQSPSQSDQQQHYSGKPQLSLVNSDGSILEQVDQVDASGQHSQHQSSSPQQYLIVNSAGQVQDGGAQAAHVVTSNGQTLTLAHGPTYHQTTGNVYHAVQAPALSTGEQQQVSYSVPGTTKYIPLSSLVANQAQQPNSYEAPASDQPSSPSLSLVSSGGQRYIACLDTCNSADPRWKRYPSARYRACCLSAAQQDNYQYESNGKVASDSEVPYAYLQRKSRGRRSRRLHHKSVARAYSGRYPNSSQQDTNEDTNSGSPMTRQVYHSDSTYLKPFYKNGRLQSSSGVLSGPSELLAGEKYLVAHPKTSSYRRGKTTTRLVAADQANEAGLEAHSAHGLVDPASGPEDEGSYPESVREPNLSSYSSSNSYMQTDGRGQAAEGDADELPLVPRGQYDDGLEQGLEPSSKADAGGPVEDQDSPITDTPSGDELTDGQYESLASANGQANHRSTGYQSGSTRRRKQHQLAKASSRKEQQGGSRKRNRNKTNKYPGKQEKYFSSQAKISNGTSIDYDATQPGDGYHQYDSANSGSSGGSGSGSDESGDQQAGSHINQKDSQTYGMDKDSGSSPPTIKSYGGQKQQSLNDSAAVASLSKTTLHLKEILSILDKKANASNETGGSYSNNAAISSTPAPITTTTSSGSNSNSLYPYSLLNSHFGNSALSGMGIAGDYLSGSELASLKSPYRYEAPSLQASLGSSSYSLPSSAYSSLSPSMAEAYSSLGGYSAHSQYPLLSPSKVLPSVHHPRKRRVNKSSIRYNGSGNPYVLPPSPQQHQSLVNNGHTLSASSALLQAAAKHPLVKQGLYSSLNYPYWYRNSSPAITNAYPYKNLSKSPYSPFLGGPVSSKLISSLYSDDAKYSGFDPISAVASSLRPSTSLRLRTKPFVFQPQVLPIYTRHSILTQPLDTKK